MEIKAQLTNYTEKQRQDFIVTYNHNQGYEIKEYTTTETKQEEVENPETGEMEFVEYTVTTKHIEAWGYTEDELELQENIRISKLTCTKRVFALMLQELGITYTMLKELIATNEQAQLEWDLCVELQRSNPLLDVMAMQLGVTAEQLDGLFRYANGEITLEQFREINKEPDVNNSEEPIEENPVIEDVTEGEIVNNLEE